MSAVAPSIPGSGASGAATFGPVSLGNDVSPGILAGNSANCFGCGLTATHPALNVDTSTALSVTGLNVKSNAAGSGVAMSAISSATDEALTIDAKGAGTLVLGSVSTGLVSIGRGAVSPPVESVTKTAIATQNAAPTAAQILGGYLAHTSVTGAGTVTTPTGTQLSAAVPGVAVGDKIRCLYANLGTQTVTVTVGASGVTLLTGSFVAIPTHRHCWLTFVNTGANAWDLITDGDAQA